MGHPCFFKTEKLNMSAESEPKISPEELQAASDYRDLLLATGKPWNHHFESTPELEERIGNVLRAVSDQIPGINTEALGKIIRVDSNTKTIDGALINLDFPVIAANWNNKVFRSYREVAEREFGIRKKEVEFLKAVFAQNPPVMMTLAAH